MKVESRIRIVKKDTEEQKIKLDLLESKVTEVKNYANSAKNDETVHDKNFSQFPENNHKK